MTGIRVMPITDLSRVDTTPGCGSPFAPPLGFQGDAEAYGAWFNKEYQESLRLSQYVYVLWRFRTATGTGRCGTFEGPYAERLRLAMERYAAKMARPGGEPLPGRD